MAHQGKKQADKLLLQNLACGAPVESAATKAGVSPRTVHRRLKDADFQRQLAEIQGDSVKRTKSFLTAAGLEAVKTLVTLMGESYPPAVRLNAARVLLDKAQSYRVEEDVVARMDAMSQRLEAVLEQGSSKPKKASLS
jgi:hypothetical protein